MNTEPTQPTKPNFHPEGQGYSLSMLETTYTPVYYGFNCRPRQVKYYKVIKSVASVLAGKTSKSVAEAFLEKVKKTYDKHQKKLQEYRDEIKLLEVKLNEEGREYYSKRYFHEEIAKIGNKLNSDNNYCKERDLKDAIEKLSSFIYS